MRTPMFKQTNNIKTMTITAALPTTKSPGQNQSLPCGHRTLSSQSDRADACIIMLFTSFGIDRHRIPRARAEVQKIFIVNHDEHQMQWCLNFDDKKDPMLMLASLELCKGNHIELEALGCDGTTLSISNRNRSPSKS